MSLLYVTPHFRYDEFDCHDGQDVPDEAKPNIRRLCSDLLEVIREEWSAPVLIVSGWRSKAWNFKCGGAPASHHLTGEAADIRPVSLEAMGHLRGVVERMIAGGKLPALGGFGTYKNWLHVDVRQRMASGHVARWQGKGVGSEAA